MPKYFLDSGTLPDVYIVRATNTGGKFNLKR